ncbi:MAG: DUF305 domain-containing protein [Clostridia bacterium]
MREYKFQNYNGLKYSYQFDQILCNMALEMVTQDITNSITVNFIKEIIPHNLAAMYMCQNISVYTNYPAIIGISESIVKTQKDMIEKMKEILKTTKGYINSSQNVNMYIGQYFKLTQNMINNMKNVARNQNINLDFTNQMILHYEGGIEIENNVLKYYIDRRLKKIIEDNILLQKRMVEEMRNLEKM